MSKQKLAALALGTGLLSMGAGAQEPAAPISEALVIVNSGSLQTQGMAMVLANAMQASGTKINILLCDQAGDLALQSTQSATLKPNNVTPEQLLAKLQQNGAKVDVCALYLPNSEHSADQLRADIGVATPPQIAQQMTHPQLRVFTF